MTTTVATPGDLAKLGRRIDDLSAQITEAMTALEAAVAKLRDDVTHLSGGSATEEV